MRVVIIGGVAGGATAATRIRRLDEHAEIIIVEKTGHVSYANCGLPYYIGGLIKDKAEIALQSPKSFKERFNIDVRVFSEALSIDGDKKTVAIKNLKSGETYVEKYDQLILSPGAKPVKPDIAGINNPKIFTLRNVEDTYAIEEYISKHKPSNGLVIGGGFIGLEMAENLVHRGIRTTLVQGGKQIMNPLDQDMACIVQGYLRSKGVDLRLGQTFESFHQEDGKMKTVLQGRNSKKISGALETDFVILAIGVEPDTAIAQKAGLELGIKNAIRVNEHMETSRANIYAVGDAVEVVNRVTGNKTLISLAGPANKQGRIAADNICGKASVFSGAIGSSIMKLFDMTVATAGINEKQARANNIPYEKVVGEFSSHATYYPGAEAMTIKTLYNPNNGRLLGTQIVGGQGVSRTIDIFATAIGGNLSADDLIDMDLAYAPPYSSAKAPVNMIGYMIENLREGLINQFHWHDVEAIVNNEEGIVLDVRSESEFKTSHLPGAINIPLDMLRDRTGEIEKGKEIYVNCHGGLRSYIACRILRQKGYRCTHLSGGYSFYSHIMAEENWSQKERFACGKLKEM